MNRRQFLASSLWTYFGLTNPQLLASVFSNKEDSDGEEQSTITIPQGIQEIYHVFLPYVIARVGGNQFITLRSGEQLKVKVGRRTQENDQKIIEGVGQNGNDILIVYHTLYDLTTRLGDQVYQEIDRTNFIEEVSKEKCKLFYEKLENGQYVSDIESLELLDYLIQSSRLDDNIKARYDIASTNSRLVGVKQALEKALEQSKLRESQKKLVRGTYEYVRASEPVPDFQALQQLDVIIANSELPLTIKQTYSLASAKSRAFTADFLIVQLICSDRLNSEQQEQYLAAYQAIRDGKPAPESFKLDDLDSFINRSDLPENAKAVYTVTRKRTSVNPEESSEDTDKKLEKVTNYIGTLNDQMEDAKYNGAKLVPLSTRALSTLGAEAGTGVGIGSLSGAAATNATLAWLGGGSVAAGGLGMLGGLTVATGGAALIGAAGLLSVALVSEMDGEDFKNLGVAVGTGTVAGATTVLAAWTAASALGVAGGLTGSAAITTTMAALGGISVITGGAALVASGTAFVIWSVLKGQKRREQSVLNQLETRLYTFVEDTSHPLQQFFKDRVPQTYHTNESFIAPNIPLDKLANALKNWTSLQANENIIALIDTSWWDDAKEGIAFTEERVIWKNTGSDTLDITYTELNDFFHSPVVEMFNESRDREKVANLLELSEILPEAQDQDAWVQLLKDVSDFKGGVSV
ncbi:hypothetical protein PN462_20215 [Spirulina sp. CS-785/01]|uniref:hypothetical protein n=1 Tax=Spirulina sp. CS-785/01 TaxID=3021716 RepID=UPI00233082EA|nr:hypothetical protein [Spirulina sp. CS-785/01]MDB9315450.1 hypothetical protein [Spirulina sp. CS-785/01]